MAILTVQFEVGVPRIDALVRLYDTMHSNRDWASPQLGLLEPVSIPRVEVLVRAAAAVVAPVPP